MEIIEKPKRNIKLERTKNINLGIGFLRVFLSFSVIIDNLCAKKSIYNSFLFYHIPTFFLISFYFTYDTFISHNINKLYFRFERLVIPYFFWSIIGWFLRIIYYHYLKINYFYKYKEFLQNLICGHIFNVALWFQSILIFTTIIFLIIIFLFKKHFLIVLQIFAIICYILQYSNINYNLNFKYLIPHGYLTFGRFAEIFPNSVTGFTFKSKRIMIKLKTNRIKSILFSIIILIIIPKYNKLDNVKTFNYGGIRLNIGAICYFICFYLLPFEQIKNKNINEILKIITSYTGGIYYMHILLGNSYLISYIFKSKNHSLISSIFIYLICYIISAIGSKILIKTKFRYIFI